MATLLKYLCWRQKMRADNRRRSATKKSSAPFHSGELSTASIAAQVALSSPASHISSMHDKYARTKNAHCLSLPIPSASKTVGVISVTRFQGVRLTINSRQGRSLRSEMTELLLSNVSHGDLLGMPSILKHHSV